MDRKAHAARRAGTVRRLQWPLESDRPNIGLEVRILEQTRLREGIFGGDSPGLAVSARLGWGVRSIQYGRTFTAVPGGRVRE